MPTLMGPVPLIVGLALALCLYLFLELKTSRSDGTLIAMHPYRRVMLHIMPTRTESVVYFDSVVNAEALVAYLEDAQSLFGADLTRAVVGAVAVGMKESPSMNHFVVGRRKYARNQTWVSMRVGRESESDTDGPHTIKQLVPESMTFRELCRRTNDRLEPVPSALQQQPGGALAALDALPAPAIRLAARVAHALDHFNLLPGHMIERDPLFCSLLVINPGHSEPGYHHLYEWGNCPLILMVGRIEVRPEKVQNRLVFKKKLHLRYAYDERIDDGLSAQSGIEAVKRVLENPHAELGCLREDESDAVFLTAHRDRNGSI